MDQTKVFERFLNMEREFLLFSKQYCDFPYWSFLRQHVYNQVCIQIGMAQGFTWTGEEALQHNVTFSILRCCENLFSEHNPMCAKQSDILFFHAPRKVKTELGYISPMIDPFLDQLSSTYSILERSVSLTHIPYSISRTVYYHDIYDVQRICSYLITRHSHIFKAAILKEITPILDAFDEEYGINISRGFIADRMLYAMLSYRTLLPKYRRLLRRLRPKIVVEICHYDVSSLCMTIAAHDEGIHVVELQHGIFSPYNSAYNFAESCCNDRCIPDFILCFGQYWIDVTRYRNKENSLIPTGFPFFEMQTKNLARATPDGKRLLIVSSPKVADCLIYTALRLCELLPPEYQVTYRLHPLEIQNWREKYPTLAACSRVHVSDNKDQTIYELFSQTDYQIGVSSLGIFEGVGLGIPAFIIKQQDYLDAEPLCQLGVALLVNSAEDIVNALTKLQFISLAPDVREKLWMSGAAHNVTEVLEKMVKGEHN